MSDLRTHIANVFLSNENWVKRFVVVFYIVGIIGLIIPVSRPLFLQLTPLALLLSFFIIILFHPHTWTLKLGFIAAIIFVSSYFVEVIGVSTQRIFGNYVYGEGLGIKILDTPLLIGLNWVFMVYASASIMDFFKWNPTLQVGGGSTIMLVYDVVLEQIAPKMDMWSWLNDVVPLQNYIAWFVLALIYHVLVRAFKIRFDNRMAIFIFLSQIMFFISLLFFL